MDGIKITDQMIIDMIRREIELYDRLGDKDNASLTLEIIYYLINNYLDDPRQ